MENVAKLNRAALAFCVLLNCGAVALAQSAAPDTAPPNAESSPPSNKEPSTAMEQPLPGDHWSYEFRDAITGVLKNTSTFTVTDVTPAEISVRAEVLGSPGIGYFVYDHSWNLKKSPIWQFSPDDGSGIKLPLNPGNTWKFQNDELNAQHGASFRRSGTSKVIGQESVTTNAGVFDTIKIETSINARNVNDPTRSSSSTTTTWYVPAVDHWVKRVEDVKANGHVVQSTSIELVDYGRR